MGKSLFLAFILLSFLALGLVSATGYSVNSTINNLGQIEYRCYFNDVHFLSIIGEPSNDGVLVIRPHPGADINGWGSSWYFQPFLNGATLKHSAIDSVLASTNGIQLKAHGYISMGASSNYGTWNSSLNIIYDSESKKINGNGTYNINLNGLLSGSTGDLNFYKIASNYLDNVPLLSGGIGDTGDMEYANTTGFSNTNLNFLWNPSVNPGYFPQDRTDNLSVEVSGRFNNVNTSAQGYAYITPAYKPSLKVVLKSKQSGIRMIFGGIYNTGLSQDFSADNVGITPLIQNWDSPQYLNYNFNVEFESKAIPGDGINKPISTGAIKINGRNLIVDGKNYTAKSVGYAPTPIGMSPDYGYDSTMHSELRARDFQLIRAMNANTIRTWGKVGQSSFLDDAWNTGVNPIRVIMGYWMGSELDYQNASVRNAILSDFSSYVKAYKDKPAVLVWAIGNEENYFYANGDNAKHTAYFSLVNEMAEEAYSIEGASYHPVMAISLEISGVTNTIGNGVGGANDSSLPFVDIWGINYYPQNTFGNFFNNYQTKTSKPLIITEYGVDALNQSSLSEYESVQANSDINLWREIRSSMAVGGSLMEYSDEFWKDYGGTINSHDYGGYSTTSQPDGFSNEEWWGIMRPVKNGSNIDIMQPRKVYYDLANEFLDLNSTWMLHLSRMPSYIKEQENYSGASTAEMILNYQRAPLSLSNLTQTEIYNYGKQHMLSSNSNLGDLDANAMSYALGHFDPYDTSDPTGYGNPVKGYNFGVESFTNVTLYMKDILHWMAWTVPQNAWYLPGAQNNLTLTPNTPAAIPIYGSYNSWVAVNGGVASENPCPDPANNPGITPNNITVYGFWLTDPKLSGIGQHTYVTAQEAIDNYFKPLVSNDIYNGTYIQVAEPSAEEETTNINIGTSESNSENEKLKNVLDNLDNSLQMRIQGETNNFNEIDWNRIIDSNLMSDLSFQENFDNTIAQTPIKVKNIKTGEYYFIIPFENTAGKISLTLIVDENANFRQASWSDGQDYLRLTKRQALILSNNINNNANAELVWNSDSQSSPFLPLWKIETSEQTIYLDPNTEYTPVCGNNILEDGEQCDGIDLNGQSCHLQGFSSGFLQCSPSCHFDTSLCINEIPVIIANNTLSTNTTSTITATDTTATTSSTSGGSTGISRGRYSISDPVIVQPSNEKINIITNSDEKISLYSPQNKAPKTILTPLLMLMMLLTEILLILIIVIVILNSRRKTSS